MAALFHAAGMGAVVGAVNAALAAGHVLVHGHGASALVIVPLELDLGDFAATEIFGIEIRVVLTSRQQQPAAHTRKQKTYAIVPLCRESPCAAAAIASFSRAAQG